MSLVAQMTEVDLRKMRTELKACGMLEDGNNYLYLGESPVKQARKAVKLLKLNASTVASLAGVKFQKPGEKGASSSSKKRPPEPDEPPRQFTREKKAKKKEEAKKKREIKDELARKKEELKERYEARDKGEHLDEKDLIANVEKKKIQEQKEKMKRKLEETKDSLERSDDEEELDYGVDVEEVPEEDERPPPVVLRENLGRHQEGWYQESWQDDDERHQEELAEEERYESRGYDREWSYGKGKGKHRNKGKRKSKGKYPRRWYEPPKISEENLIGSLIKKAERHQAEWTEMPRNRTIWDKLSTRWKDDCSDTTVWIQ